MPAYYLEIAVVVLGLVLLLAEAFSDLGDQIARAKKAGNAKTR